MNARSTALAEAQSSIDASQQRAVAARAAQSKPKSALEAMASRLSVSPAGLETTLTSTVFKSCKSREEFIALVIVANEYGLNPLTKEIYAFPAKGGGIVPMVSVDGWIRIMNEHAQFDGIEFENIVDQQGNVEAIEAVIYRKDISHPIKVIEYLKECQRNTDPWKLMPNRMLRNRALIQGVRIAFGFAGISTDGDETELGSLRPMHDADYGDEPVILPGPKAEVEQDDEADLPRDPQTGMTEVDEDTARKLDAGEETEPDDGAEGAEATVAELMTRAREVSNADELSEVQRDFIALAPSLTPSHTNSVSNALGDAAKRLQANA